MLLTYQIEKIILEKKVLKLSPTWSTPSVLFLNICPRLVALLQVRVTLEPKIAVTFFNFVSVELQNSEKKNNFKICSNKLTKLTRNWDVKRMVNAVEFIASNTSVISRILGLKMFYYNRPTSFDNFEPSICKYFSIFVPSYIRSGIAKSMTFQNQFFPNWFS